MKDWLIIVGMLITVVALCVAAFGCTFGLILVGLGAMDIGTLWVLLGSSVIVSCAGLYFLRW